MTNRVVLRYGTIGALIMVALFALSWALLGTRISYRTSEILGYLTMILALSTVFFGMRTWREQENGGILTFGQGVRIGLGITLLPSVAFFLYIVLFMTWRGEEFLAYAAENMSAEQVAQMEAQKELFLNPFFQGAVMFVTVFLIGLGITLVSALVLRRK